MVVRRAEPSDRPNLVKAVVELQNYERELHETRCPASKLPMPIRVDVDQCRK